MRTGEVGFRRSSGRAECCFGGFVVEVSGEGGIGEASGFAGFGVGETLTFAVEDEFRVVDELHAVGGGELLRARTDEVDMRTLLKDETRGVDRIAKPLDAGNTTGFHAAAVHQESVELNAAVGGEEAAAAGVEGRIVFEDGNRGFDGVDGSAAAGKHLVADFEGATYAGFVGGGRVGGNGPGSSMNEQGGVMGGRLGRHSDMVEHSARERLSSDTRVPSAHKCLRKLVSRGPGRIAEN